MVLFVLTPLVAIACVSFSAADYISFPWDEGFSLDSYAEIPNKPEFLTAAWNSVELAFYASVAALLIGLFASIAVVRHSFSGCGLVLLLGSSPLFVPQVLTGLALSLALVAAVSVVMIAVSIIGIVELQRLVGLDKLSGGEAELR